MIHWGTMHSTRPMVIARIEFRPEHAHAFVEKRPDGSQPLFVEMRFDSPEELVDILKQFEFAIKDCLADVNGRIICLSGFKTT